MLSRLNPSQTKAATHIDGPLLILAGAGSGKTTTITTRLAYLISAGIDPSTILTLTFTNKAAKQMHTRAFDILNDNNITPITPPLLCTFHKFGLLFLKMHINKIGRKNNFIIIDTDDRKRILRSLAKGSDIAPSILGDGISKMKNTCYNQDEVLRLYSKKDSEQINKLNEKYEQYLSQNNLVDFDDLILLPYLILKNDEEFAKEISQKYQYIMVDEYQDTNELQYELLRLLTSSHNNICVVGDDDQSIYGWRGANINNILNFTKNFKGATTIKIEENYRSCGNILKASNMLIEYNTNRLGKKLIATKEDGKEVELFECKDEKEEGSKIINKIKQLLKDGANESDIAILFRVHALSRGLEDSLNRAGINYKLIGGVRFYERAEIKDFLAYLRLITKSYDDLFLKRIINTPKRSIGSVSIEKLQTKAQEASSTIFQYLIDVSSSDLSAVVGAKNARTLKVFVSNILDLQDELKNNPSKLLELFDDTFELKNYYSNLLDGVNRVDNIEELIGYLRELLITKGFDLKAFLDELALDCTRESLDNAINLMSIHAAKGLEYDYVFIIGMENGFFPMNREYFDVDINEERRLAYVAFTRAKKELYLSQSHNRFYKGFKKALKRSQFLVESGVVKGSIDLDTIINNSSSNGSFKKDDLVKHSIFGIGRVLSVGKAGSNTKLSIKFANGNKDILSSFVQKI